jgi:hypothetical protein
MRPELSTSRPVMFASASGSFGRIVETVPDHGIHGTVYHVEWNYGRDVKDEAILSTSRYTRAINLCNIDERLYAEYIKCRAWSDEQTPIRDKIIAKVREWNRWI